MGSELEALALERVAQRLTGQFTDLGKTDVCRVVGDCLLQFVDSPMRTYVPLRVEHAPRTRLRTMSPTGSVEQPWRLHRRPNRSGRSSRRSSLGLHLAVRSTSVPRVVHQRLEADFGLFLVPMFWDGEGLVAGQCPRFYDDPGSLDARA